MKRLINRLIGNDRNQRNRDSWVSHALAGLPQGSRLLDAGAGQQRYRQYCEHLQYVSQDFAEYDGRGNSQGLQVGSWDYGSLDIVSDIAAIPEPDESFDAILCTEVLEHIPDPLKALDEFSRLLKPGGHLILTAPFASLVHFAPYFFATGFSRYWYEHHLPLRKMRILEVSPNGDWFTVVWQELIRLPSMGKRYRDWFWWWAYAGLSVIGSYFLCRMGRRSGVPSADLACFGFHVHAIKQSLSVNR